MLDAEVPWELSLICLRSNFELLFSSMLILFDEVNFDAGDSIVIAKSFSHMHYLANLAEEVQIA